MRTSVERLRIGLLVGAGLLVLVIAAFLGYARYKVHRALVDLPGKLGATITKEFNGYTYSQSDGKKTIFTIHAAKAVQHTDGNYSLHDVNMVLYGKKGDRADRISGDDFEYDTKNEIIHAVGIVHLDLQAPEAQNTNTSESAKHLAGAAASETAHETSIAGGRIIHIKTSGLVYLKALGIAATKEGIEFAFGGFTGHAVGAEYNSDTGHVILQSAVTVSGLDKGRPVALAASHGELDRASNLADFDNARYNSAGQTARADLAHIHLRADSSIERIEGERHVLLEEAGQGSSTSDRANLTLDPTNKPKIAILTGSVHFVDDEPLRQTHGDSDRANLSFDAQGHLNHAVLEGRAHATERLRGSGEGNQAWAQRDLTSDTLDLVLAAVDAPANRQAKPQLRDATATGAAHLTSVAPASKGPGTETSKLSGDILTAHFIAREGIAELSTVHGTGHTLVEQTAATGINQTSSGSILDAQFRPSAKGNAELATAVQQGEVVINRTLPAKPTSSGTAAAAEIQHATAAKAVYDAATDHLTLTGNVQMSDATSAISASRVIMEQGSGNATADGSVKVSYSQPGSAEPVHVLAARADLNHASARATFYGSSANGGPGLARMWQPGTPGQAGSQTGSQGGSQIDAPVLVFEQEQKRLTARAEVPGTPATVHVALADNSSAKSPPAPAKSAARDASKPTRQGVARITSSQMIYSDIDRQAEFTGGVKLLDSTGEMHAQQATVYLAPAAASKAPKSQTPVGAAGLNGLFGGNVERIVATQHIDITQPGRKATGERLVYTASDQMFVLTGNAGAPPKVVDAVQGTTTGASLRFHSGDDSVVVSGHDGDAPTQKVHTETRVKQQ
jgi:lipopolysaccharide export system protein LptA